MRRMVEDRDLWQLLKATEASRRVGWAKYYEAVDGQAEDPFDVWYDYDTCLTLAGAYMWLLFLTWDNPELADMRAWWMAEMVMVVRQEPDAAIWAEMRAERIAEKPGDPELVCHTILTQLRTALDRPGPTRRDDRRSRHDHWESVRND